MTFINSDRDSNFQDSNSHLSDENALEKTSELNELENINISLLEEKLKVTRRKQKVGEIVVRKEIETKTVKIPIRREKLIVERIGKNPERLAEEIINEEKVNGFGYSELKNGNGRLHTIRSQYISLEQAQNILADISRLHATDNPKIRIELVTENSDLQQQYQNISDRY